MSCCGKEKQTKVHVMLQVPPARDMTFNLVLKVITVGPVGVGKTCLLRTFTDGVWPETTVPTIGLDSRDFTSKNARFNGKAVQYYFWDTAGQEKYDAISAGYFRTSHIVLVCCDLSQQYLTYPDMDAKVIEEIREKNIAVTLFPKYLLKAPADCKFLFVGTKADLQTPEFCLAWIDQTYQNLCDHYPKLKERLSVCISSSLKQDLKSFERTLDELATRCTDIEWNRNQEKQKHKLVENPATDKLAIETVQKMRAEQAEKKKSVEINE